MALELLMRLQHGTGAPRCSLQNLIDLFSHLNAAHPFGRADDDEL
jgi:hypothetical protein